VPRFFDPSLEADKQEDAYRQIAELIGATPASPAHPASTLFTAPQPYSDLFIDGP
jgi:hypothetical protein